MRWKFWQRPKLYAWRPRGHGQYSFMVLAYSEKEALQRVNKEIWTRQNLLFPDYHRVIYDHDIDGWGTDYYELTVREVGEVMLHEND